MRKPIIMLVFLFALLSTAVLRTSAIKENSVKAYSNVAVQFAYHVPDTQYWCTTNHLF